MNILWVKTGPLHPLDTGGKLRTYNMLRELSARHRISYLTLVSERQPADWRQRAQEYCSEVVEVPWTEIQKSTFAFYTTLAANMAFSRYPYAVAKYRSPRMKRLVSRMGKEADLVVCDFLAPSLNVGRVTAPTLLFQHNVESQIWERHYHTARGMRKLAFRSEWQRMVRYEYEACKRFDGVVTVSPNDSLILRNYFHLDRVLGHVPTGVDTEYFRPLERIARRTHHLVFTGSMDWMPNEDAVLYFVDSIYPRIKRRIPDLTFTVAGRNPSWRIKDLERTDPSIRVTGTVDDIRPYMAEAAAMVLPLRIGGGTRIKIYEGMAMGLPVVSTSVGAEGLPLKGGVHIEIVDDPVIFAAAAGDLLLNPDKAKRISENGRGLVLRNFSWKEVAGVFEKYCSTLIDRHEVAGSSGSSATMN